MTTCEDATRQCVIIENELLALVEGLNGVQCSVFAVKLANFLLFTVSGENAVKCLEGFS